jgi:hypothetical protein
MPPKEKTELQVFNLEKFSIAQLPEFQAKKEEISSVIELNPIVIITDSSTYELAKKSRTAVKSLRTGLEKEQADVKRKIKKNILDVVDNEYELLVSDVKKQEASRQDPITNYEAEIEFKRQEKARLEQQRIDNIKKEIEDYVAEWKNTFANMTFETIEKVGADFLESYTTYDLTVLEEFESFFPKKVEELTNVLSYHTTALTEKENARLEKLILEEEAKKLATMKAELEAEKKRTAEVEARAKFEKEQFEKEKAEFEENKRIEKQKSEYQLKVDGRISQLTDLELKFDFQSTFVGFNFFIDILDIKTYDDEKWNALILKIEEVKSTPLPETIKGIEVEEQAIELIQNIDSPDPIEPTANVCMSLDTEKPKNIVEHLIPIVDAMNVAELKEMQSSATVITWDSIAEDFKNSGGKSYSKWLKDNYNVPTKI